MSGNRVGLQRPRIVKADEVTDALAAKEKFQSHLDEASSLLSSIESRQLELEDRIQVHRRLLELRQRFDGFIGRTGSIIVLLVLSCAVMLVFCHAIGLPVVVPAILMLATSATMAHWAVRLYKPSDSQLNSELANWEHDRETLQGQEQETRYIVSRATALFREAEAKHLSLFNAFESRINRLRLIDWRILQGIPFEEFLADVFREWGFDVETTKASGDQGVDLRVTKNGVKTAVQAKGYVSSTVGNTAIQQAFTGMKFYNCDKCMVITNSTFTASAGSR